MSHKENDKLVDDVKDREEGMKISELNEEQNGHLAWRLDHKTACGYLTAIRIAKGKLGDDDLVTIFKKMGKSNHSAKIHARKVINFSLSNNPIREGI